MSESLNGTGVPATPERVRVKAGSAPFTGDSFANFQAGLGYGAQNLSSANTYTYNPLSRNRQKLDWMYRSSWLVRVVVDATAEDMTRAGITFESDMAPDDMDKFYQYLNRFEIWQSLCASIKWSRLYGGSIAVIMVDRQDMATPLNLDSIGKEQFKGLLVLDRWQINQDYGNLVQELGPDFGLPAYYTPMSGMPLSGQKIHHSRVIRLIGADLPYWQKITENYWGLSVIEPFADRLMAFDSATAGASQLLFKAYLRTMKVKDLRTLLGAGGPGERALMKQMEMIRLMQTNEGLTIIDAEDSFETASYNFGGISEVIEQFAQQVSGAAQTPIVRLFGQSPGGMNATGESDMRNYYDFINAQQEAKLRRPMHMVFDVAHRSLFGRPLPEGFDFSFNPLWQLTDEQKAAVALNITNAVTSVLEAGVIGPATALKEYRQSSKITGVWSNITDEEIKTAEDDAPAPSAIEPAMPLPGAGALFGQPASGNKPAEAPKEAKPVNAPTTARSLNADAAVNIKGIEVQLEQPGVRYPDGHDRATDLPGRYGFIGDAQRGLPALIGTDPDSDSVWLVAQHDADTQQFENLKIIIGASDRETAMNLFQQSFTDGKAEGRVGSFQRTNIDGLRAMLAEWQSSVPALPQVAQPRPQAPAVPTSAGVRPIPSRNKFEFQSL